MKNYFFDKKYRKLVLLGVLVLFVFISGSVISYYSQPKIERILMKSDYSYLPKEAQNYIKDVYEETGEVVLTEKNKKENIPYLNPLYVAYLSMSDEEKKQEAVIPNPMITDYQDSSSAEYNLPDTYDLRDVDGKNYVTPIRNQGSLGLCWTFATTSVAETNLLLENKMSYTSSSQLFSERQIDYATSLDGIYDYKSEYVSFIDRYLGDGGNFYISTIAMANGISLVDYSWKEYDDSDFSKMELYEVLNYDKSLYEVNTTINMPSLNSKDLDESEESENIRTSFINTIKSNIVEHGAAFVTTYYNNKCYYTDSSANNLVLDVDDSCVNYGGAHAMTIIGWDDNVEYDYCADEVGHVDDVSNCSNVVKGKGVWILKNSWGEENDPYPYLAYDSSYSGISFLVDASSNSEKKWDNNYIVGSKFGVTGSSNSLADSSIRGEEKLSAIKFLTDGMNSTYSVKILKSDGTYSDSYVVGSELPGLVTLDLSDKNLMVNSDSVIEITGGNNYFIDFISVFTNNVSENFYVDLSPYNNLIISDDEIRLYSVTKNIPANTTLKYELFDSNGNNVSDKVIVKNNIVAENNVNTLISSLSSLDSGDYTVKVSYNEQEVSSFYFSNLQMSGSGTENDPYVILNSSHLNQIRNDLDAYYVLGADIDLTEDTREGGKFYNEPEGEYAVLGGHGWEPINEFNGSLDGQGHIIKGMYQKTFMSERIDNTKYTARVLPEYGGLFGKTTQNVTIKNLVLEDFDVTCHGDCGLLVGHHQDPSGDYAAYNVNFSNIAVKNSKLDLVYDNNSIYAGGVFGVLAGNPVSTLNISNIYVDVDIKSNPSLAYVGSLANSINSFKAANINNIQLLGKIENFDDYYDASVLIYDVLGAEVNIENVFSTVYNETFGSNLIYDMTVSSQTDFSPKLSVKNLNMLKIPEREMFYKTSSVTDENATFENNNFYELNSAVNSMIDRNNYNSWSNFDDSWVMKTIDGIDRFPILKFVDFEYTSIPDIYIVQKLNEKKNIYDYITPDTSTAKRVLYKSNDENVVTIDDSGYIIPQASGSTTIHVESFYDGYVKDVPITIEYEPHYTVKFDANGGEGSMEDFEISANSSAILPEGRFTRQYYSFNGWNTEADGSGTAYNDLDYINPANDKEVITLYAQWLGEEYEITFDPDGGVTPVTSKKVRYNELYGELPIPYKDGYGFVGWKICSNCDYAVPTGKVYYPSEKTSVLTANWRSNAYTIAFNPNGGDGYTTSMYAINGIDKELDANTFTKKGYTFAGWNTDADGSGTSYSDEEVINLSEVENSLLFLYAQWEPYSYTITFDSNGGEGTMSDMNVDFDESVALSSNSFTKVGYTFTGWNTETDGSGTSYTNGQLIKSLSSEDDSTIKLYAQWSANTYEVIFDANGGSGTMSNQSITYDSDANLNENAFIYDGYSFVEWNTNSDGTGTSYKDKDLVKNLTTGSSITLYAIWEEDSFSYEIKEYTLDEENNYIDSIPAKISLDDYKKNIVISDGCILEIDLGTKEYIYTGSKTKIYKGDKLVVEFTNIVRGDTNGDGKISSLDYIRVKNHIMKTNIITDKVLMTAADANVDNKISSLDYIRIKNIIMKEAE